MVIAPYNLLQSRDFGKFEVRRPGRAKLAQSPFPGRYGNHLSEMATIRPSALRSMLDERIGDLSSTDEYERVCLPTTRWTLNE
jgi:hypothetical protein